jgi:hypothetical protein
MSQFLVEAVGQGCRDARRRDRGGPRQNQAAGRGGPEADLPNATVEPCDLYGTF